MNEFTHIDLFSGIGGFALAARWTGFKTVVFCEKDKWCQRVLAKNFGAVVADTEGGKNNQRECGSVEQAQERRESGNAAAGIGNQSFIHSDIHTFPAERYKEAFLLTGGFPCQPFSCAGKRKGTEDSRHLWPAMLRVIKIAQPQWIIAENVRGLLTIEGGVVFEQVCADLEGEGYAVQPFIIPAVAVNAPHRRDRVWFVAHRRNGTEGTGLPEGQQTGQRGERSDDKDSHASDTEEQGLEGRITEGACGSTGQIAEHPFSRFWNNEGRPDWNTNWLEVASFLCRMDDGLPVELDGFKLSKAGHRVERLKSLGNAIVPQVAAELMRMIKLIEQPHPPARPVLPGGGEIK